jgi:hypothetical protein
MKKKHDNKCECCENGVESVQQKEREFMEKVGWFSHIVLDDPDYPHGVNIHTHGMSESFNHKDIQICLPLDPKIAHWVFVTIYTRIKDGFIFTTGVEYDNVLENYNVKFIDAFEGDRYVLRLILPSPKGEYDKESPYKEQFTKTHINKNVV